MKNLLLSGDGLLARHSWPGLNLRARQHRRSGSHWAQLTRQACRTKAVMTPAAKAGRPHARATTPSTDSSMTSMQTDTLQTSAPLAQTKSCQNGRRREEALICAAECLAPAGIHPELGIPELTTVLS